MDSNIIDIYGPDTSPEIQYILDWITFNNVSEPLNLKRFNLHTIPPLPDTVTKLVLGNEYLVNIPLMPYNLQDLRCNLAPNLRRIPPFPPSVIHVNVAWTQITELTFCGLNLKSLNASATKLRKVPYLFTGIEELRVSGSDVKILPCAVLPATLKILDISGTGVRRLPKLNKRLNLLNISNTKIVLLPELPFTIRELSVYACNYLAVKRLTDESIQDYGERWLDWHEINRIVIRNQQRCITIKEELMSSTHNIMA